MIHSTVPEREGGKRARAPDDCGGIDPLHTAGNYGDTWTDLSFPHSATHQPGHELDRHVHGSIAGRVVDAVSLDRLNPSEQRSH